MPDPRALGPWLRRFLEEYLVSERNLARNTQLSYRDTLALLLPFAAARARRPVDRLTVRDLNAECVRAFLAHIEEERGCSARTRNQRLAAIRAFARYVAAHNPEQVEWCGQVCTIPVKKVAPPALGYLEKPELDALLDVPDPATQQGRREHSLLLFLYHSGARVSEAAQLTVGDLQLAGQGGGHALVTLRGKGGKLRRCPLLNSSQRALANLVAGRAAGEAVFLNRRGNPLTRSGMYQLVRRCAAKAVARAPSLARKRVGPHVLRHTAATHMLRAGVDLNTIRAWLGHASLDTTTIYAEIDLELKARAVAVFDSEEQTQAHSYRDDAGLMAFLRSL